MQRRWGPDGAKEIWNSATLALVMGGSKETQFLEDISRLAGEYDREKVSTTRGSGNRSRQNSHQTELVFKVGDLRLIPDAAALEWPATINDIIQARVDRLEEPVKETVQIAAVVGRQFELRLLTRVSSRPSQIASHLEALKRLDVIHEARFFPKLEYRFKHAVIQDVIYKSLLAPRRQALHGIVARSIEDLSADQLEEQGATTRTAPSSTPCTPVIARPGSSPTWRRPRTTTRHSPSRAR